MINYQTITIDLQPDYREPVVQMYLSESDVGRPIQVNVLMQGQPYLFPEGAEVKINFRKPSGHIVQISGNYAVGSNVVLFTAVEQMTAEPGMCLTELSIVGDGQDPIGSKNWLTKVELSPLHAGDPSETWIEDLDELVQDAMEGHIDATLSIPGDAADAAAVGEELANLSSALNDISEVQIGANIFDGLFPQNGYLDTDGSELSSTTYKRTDFIPVDSTPGTLYFLRSAQPYVLNLVFYDSTKTAILNTATSARTAIFNANSTDLRNTKTIPSNAAYFRMYTHGTNYTGTLAISYTELAQYVPYSETTVLKDDIVSEDKLDQALRDKINKSVSGKKIVMMGDSIVGNFNDSTGICAQIAARTGATVINCGFGGTRMAYRYSKYGDATPGATGYVDGATDAQKNNCDQYRMWNALSGYGLAQAIATGTWTLQDNAVANLAQALDYFAARLEEMKAIDWSTVDYILWEYGANDFSAGVMLSDTVDTTNMFAYDNAYRGAIEAILTAYPQIQIIPITPLWRWWSSGSPSYSFVDDSNTHSMTDYLDNSRLLPAFATKAQEIAREYQMPCIDDYWTMGANKLTYLSYYGASDGAHPNAEGRERIAEHIVSQLDAVV